MQKEKYNSYKVALKVVTNEEWDGRNADIHDVIDDIAKNYPDDLQAQSLILQGTSKYDPHIEIIRGKSVLKIDNELFPTIDSRR